jgi:hypothetical protein
MPPDVSGPPLDRLDRLKGGSLLRFLPVQSFAFVKRILDVSMPINLLMHE